MRPCYPPKPSHSPRPAPASGYLMQKIVACEKRSLPCLCTEWCLEGCTGGSIQQVTACGTPVWTAANGCTLHITLPVSVRVCDSCGQCCTYPASVHVETDLPHAFLCSMGDARSNLLILPSVRLICAENTACGCYRVKMAVSLEICLLRYETVCCGPPLPQCPQLPLYPPPMC